jgi:hypothetical protein
MEEGAGRKLFNKRGETNVLEIITVLFSSLIIFSPHTGPIQFLVLICHHLTLVGDTGFGITIFSLKIIT